MQREVYLVNWEKQQSHIEIFDDLLVFTSSYPRYSLDTLSKTLAFGITVFEDEDVCIEKKTVLSSPKPDFPRMFFWDFNYDSIDWKGNSATVIQRMIERGTSAEHWPELIRYYGKETIVNALKDTITYLPEESIHEASLYFKINKEDMLCYKRKQSQPVHWL